jgi:hypothetical protein
MRPRKYYPHLEPLPGRIAPSTVVPLDTVAPGGSQSAPVDQSPPTPPPPIGGPPVITA